MMPLVLSAFLRFVGGGFEMPGGGEKGRWFFFVCELLAGAACANARSIVRSSAFMCCFRKAETAHAALDCYCFALTPLCALNPRVRSACRRAGLVFY